MCVIVCILLQMSLLRGLLRDPLLCEGPVHPETMVLLVSRSLSWWSLSRKNRINVLQVPQWNSDTHGYYFTTSLAGEKPTNMLVVGVLSVHLGVSAHGGTSVSACHIVDNPEKAFWLSLDTIVQFKARQSLWWLCWSLRVLLMMGVLFCCGAGFFIRRRMYPSPLRDEPAFNVSFTRHPVTTPGKISNR